jgi:hypothetical protein
VTCPPTTKRKIANPLPLQPSTKNVTNEGTDEGTHNNNVGTNKSTVEGTDNKSTAKDTNKGTYEGTDNKIQPPNANSYNNTRGTEVRTNNNSSRGNSSSSTNSSDISNSATKEEPRSVADDSTQPTKDTVELTRPYEQTRLPPPTPSVGVLGDCMIPFEASFQSADKLRSTDEDQLS